MPNEKSKSGGAEHEAHIRGSAPEGIDAELDEHGLTVLKVSEGDKAEPDPLHAGPKKLGLSETPFDPNAALRAKAGYGPGLQDSEAIHPAVWTEGSGESQREAAADAKLAEAERAYKRAKAEAEAIRKGEPY